jgi:hypothetical protein
LSDDVDDPTVALLVRFRVHVTLPGREGPQSKVAEEARVVAFTGTPDAPAWLGSQAVERLVSARPSANLPADVVRNSMSNVLAALPAVSPHLERQASGIADEIRDAHVRVRTAARGDRAGVLGIRGLDVRPQLPVDVLGVYLYRPTGGRP